MFNGRGDGSLMLSVVAKSQVTDLFTLKTCFNLSVQRILVSIGIDHLFMLQRYDPFHFFVISL